MISRNLSLVIDMQNYNIWIVKEKLLVELIWLFWDWLRMNNKGNIMFLNGSNLEGLTFYGCKWRIKFKLRVQKKKEEIKVIKLTN